MPELWRIASRATAILSLCAASCGLPRDPKGTTERLARTHELRVGFTDNPPWTLGSAAEPSGIEPGILRDFARQFGAKVAWTRGSETGLVQSLKHNQLDVVIGGFDKKTQWSSTVGVTQPFAEDETGKKHVMLAAPGENNFILSLDRFLTERMMRTRGRA